MANTIKTVMTYPLNGSTVDFNIPFEYLARKFVTITLIGTDHKVLVLNQDYRFSTKTTITLTKAWGPSDGYDTIEVRRYTSATDRLVDFADGSILRAYDLNIAQVQTLHVAEEARDLTADTIGVNNYGNLDARGRRIVNVADAVEDYDAINLHMMRTWNTSALNSANAAAASQAAAKVSENNSKASENAAKASQTDAASSMNGAYQWAQRAEDSPVQGSEFSSYHYSRKAAKSAAAASVSEGNSKVSENNSKTSENNSKTSETNAAASAQVARDEAAKLGNMNDLAAAIESVSGTAVSWKCSHWMKTLELRDDQPFIDFHYGNSGADYTARIIADSSARLRISSNLRVDGEFAVGGNAGITGNLTVAGTGRNAMPRLHINGKPAALENNQGLHMAWNEESTGEANFINNVGSGAGGFRFRSVNAPNNQELGRVTFSGDGAIVSTGNIQGADVQSRGNMISNNSVYAGGPSGAIMAADGNIKGSMWGGDWLSNYIVSDNLFTKTAGGRIKGWDGVPNGRLALRVDNNTYTIAIQASDEKLKSDIKDASQVDALEAINKVELKSFNVKYFEGTEGEFSEYGFIAQQVEKVLPTAIYDVEGGYKQVNTLVLIGALIGSVKELTKRVQELEDKE